MEAMCLLFLAYIHSSTQLRHPISHPHRSHSSWFKNTLAAHEGRGGKPSPYVDSLDLFLCLQFTHCTQYHPPDHCYPRQMRPLLRLFDNIIILRDLPWNGIPVGRLLLVLELCVRPGSSCGLVLMPVTESWVYYWRERVRGECISWMPELLIYLLWIIFNLTNGTVFLEMSQLRVLAGLMNLVIKRDYIMREKG